MSSHRDHLVLPATVDNIPHFRDFVERACVAAGADEDDRFALILAADEACSNIVEHGYRGAPGGAIELLFESDAGEMRVVIADTGRSFRPEEAALPDLQAGWEDRPLGGLGWHLIRQVVDDIRYETGRGSNRLTLVKQRARARLEGAGRDGREG